MTTTFDIIFKRTCEFEGVYSDEPTDPGGETYSGISRRSWPNWKGWDIVDKYKKLYGTGSKFKAAIVKDTVLQSAIKEFYKEEFWDKCKGDKIGGKIGQAVFDFAVNAGTSVAQSILQKSVNVFLKYADLKAISEDGIIGLISLNAIASLNPEQLLDEYLWQRVHWYGTRSASLRETYMSGWVERTADLRDFLVWG